MILQWALQGISSRAIQSGSEAGELNCPLLCCFAGFCDTGGQLSGAVFVSSTKVTGNVSAAATWCQVYPGPVLLPTLGLYLKD